MIQLLAIILLLFFQPPKEERIDFDILLKTIRVMESSDGINCGPRFEPKFLEKYGNSGNMPKLRKLYGDKAASSSWGKYQIMLSTANMYFDISPTELSKSENNEKIAEFLIKKYIKEIGDKESSLTKIFVRWNGGSEYAIKALSVYYNLRSKKDTN